jgi:8-oxo-dGTP diphosphatase
MNVRVGTAAVIVRDNKVLLGKRRGSHAANVWALPGGHLEWGEEFEECVAREVLEETGLVCTKVLQSTFSNNILPKDDKHYVTLYFICEVNPGEPEVLEPNKCAGWRWFALDELPADIWPGLDKTLGRMFN